MVSQRPAGFQCNSGTTWGTLELCSEVLGKHAVLGIKLGCTAHKVLSFSGNSLAPQLKS